MSNTAKITSINEVSRMQKFDELLGNEKELHLVKGQLHSACIVDKKGGNGQYIAFRIRCIKNSGQDEYSQSFNSYQVIVPEERAKHFSPDMFKELNKCEVVALLESNCSTRKGSTGSPVYFNNATFYLVDIMKTREIHNEFKPAAGFKELI